MINQSVKVSPQKNFTVTKLLESVAICEAQEDRYNWGNATGTEPAFLVYLGCQRDEAKGHIKTFQSFYRCGVCEIRKPKYLKGFEVEIKIRGMQRYSDSHAFGLDYLTDSQEWQEFGCDREEYSYYCK